MNVITLPATHLRFVDGPLLDNRQRREDIVRRMAADLVEMGAPSDKRDIIRALLSKGYPALDVARLWEDAWQVAAQAKVAREMSAPAEPCPYCTGDETKCDFSFATGYCSEMVQHPDSYPKREPTR